MRTQLDLTTGSSMQKIVLFSIPFVFTSLFQQLYNFIDTLIIARLLGVDSLAAIGVYYPLSFLILGFVQGSCVGFTIPLAQHVGEQDAEGTKKDLLSGTLVCLGLAIILTPLMMFLTRPLLVLLQTPNSILQLTTIFTIVSFAGIPANILYNYTANVLRAFGDSTHPFYNLTLSLFINIALALLFILQFHLGLVGIAIATVISEFLAGGLNLLFYWRHQEFTQFTFSKTYFSPTSLKRVCLIGFPMGFEYSVSAIGAIVMQTAINYMGATAIAAQSAGDKIRQLFTLPMESVGMAIATYVAQNYGAQKGQRIRNGIRDGSIIQITWSVFCLVLILLFANPLISLVLGLDHGRVFDMTKQYLITVSFFFIAHGLLMIFRNTLQGLGHSMYAVVSGVGELIGRSIASVIAVATLSYTAICYANQLAWGISLLYCIFMAWWIFRKDSRLSRSSKSLD